MDFGRAGADVIALGVQACPFLRSMVKDTGLNPAKPLVQEPEGRCPAQRGPIFCDEPNFESALRLFHGVGGVVPLKRFDEPEPPRKECARREASAPPHPLSAAAATISLSAFGGGNPNPFSWDGLMAARKQHRQAEPARGPEPVQSSKHSEGSVRGRDFASQQDILKSRAELGKGPKSQAAASGPKPAKAAAVAEPVTEPSTKHHLFGEAVDAKEWLSTSDCPIAKMHRTILELAPAAKELFRGSTKNLTLTCPAPIIAARAALAKTPPVRQLRPKPLQTKLLAVGGSCLLVNLPLGAWREHVDKFSPEWFVAVHAAVPFIAMLRKAVVMPKHAMILTIFASILGQILGSRGERYRVQRVAGVQHQAGVQKQGLTSTAQALQGADLSPESRGVQRAVRREVSTEMGQEEQTAGLTGLTASDGGALDLFSGKAGGMGWTASKVKSRSSNRKPCGPSWKMPGAQGLGVGGKLVSVH